MPKKNKNNINRWSRKKLKKQYKSMKKKFENEKSSSNSLSSSLVTAQSSLASCQAKVIRIKDYFEAIPDITWPGEPFDPFDPTDPNHPEDPDDPGRPLGRDCIDFEDLVAGKEYPHSAGAASSFESEGVTFEVIAESDVNVLLPANPAVGGKVVVAASPGAGVRNCPFDFGQSLMLNNVLLKVDVTQLPDWKNGASTACFKYCDTGGHCYLRVNGQVFDFAAGVSNSTPGQNTQELFNYDGLTIGGVNVRVTKHLYGATSSSGSSVPDHFGMVWLTENTDTIKTIEVGGQEFWTDYWCIPCDEKPPPGLVSNP